MKTTFKKYPSSYVKTSADSEAQQLCKTAEKLIKENLVSAGLKKKYLSMLAISVTPAGSGFRATVVLPKKAFHGAKESEFFYKRDLENTIQALCNSVCHRRNLIERQDELSKPDRPKSSTQIALSEARNSRDPDKLRELAKHSAKTVRDLVAKNQNTPEDALFDFLNTTYVNLGRFKSPEYLYKIFDLGDILLNYQLAFLKYLPEDLYYDLFDFGLDNFDTKHDYVEGKDIIGQLATNSSTPQDIYYKIYELNDADEDWHLVCGARLYNCPIPQDIVDGILERHPDWEGRFK